MITDLDCHLARVIKSPASEMACTLMSRPAGLPTQPPCDMPFTQDKELEAAEIGRRFRESFAAENRGHAIGDDARIWNNPRRMFDNPIRGKPVLVGVHIGGSPAVVGSAYEGLDESWHSCTLQSSPDDPCNEWVCARHWDAEGKTAQGKIYRVFDSLFGPGRSRGLLLETPSFDACPVRANEADQIPRAMWDASKAWFYSVLEHLQPSLIICNRNTEPGGNGKSAWAAVLQNRAYRARPTFPYTLIHGTGRLKSADITAGPLTGTKVIGLPHLTRFGTQKLWDALVDLGTELDLQ